MSRSRLSRFLLLIVLPLLISGCMSFRSDIHGSFKQESVTLTAREPVAVFFYFSHLEQSKGFDVVPKIILPRRGFKDILQESMKQINNIKTFATFTDAYDDIDNVNRRRMRDSLKEANDYTVHVVIRREHSFAKHFLADLFAGSSLSVLPVAYSWEYIFTAHVTDRKGIKIKHYERTAQLETWTQALLIFFYPFNPPEVKIEEIYLESLKDIFREIEADGVLAGKGTS